MKKIFKWLTLAIASACVCMALVACTPSSLGKAQSKMIDEGYTVTVYNADDVKNYEGCVGKIVATKSDEGIMNSDRIEAYLFESKDDATNFLNSDSNPLKTVSEWFYGSPVQDGKWVYAGTGEAIADFTE